MKAISLFSGAGIGEFYLQRLGIDVVAANEIIEKRAETHSLFYPSCTMITADITKEETQKRIIEIGKANKVQLIIATPPCQGLSSAGSNKTESSLYNDPRNFLILSALKIVDELLPDYFSIENVPRFQQMLFPYDGSLVKLKELLALKYGNEYQIQCDVLNAADYGVPQTRLLVSSLPADIDNPPFLSETAFRQVIGEGIPPLMMEKIMKGIGKE